MTATCIIVGRVGNTFVCQARTMRRFLSSIMSDPRHFQNLAKPAFRIYGRDQGFRFRLIWLVLYIRVLYWGPKKGP